MKTKMIVIAGMIAGLFPSEAHADTGESVVNVKVVKASGGVSSGSGFFVDSHIIMTASHVVHNEGEDVRVYFRDYSYAKAHVVMDDVKGDVALLQVDGKAGDVTPLKLMGAPKSGDSLTVEGWPTEEAKHPNTPGTVYLIKYESVYRESVGKLKEAGEHLVMSNAIKPGYSGGPVLNAAGHVVGMAWAHRPDTGESLAVPVATLAKDLRAYYLGVGL